MLLTTNACSPSDEPIKTEEPTPVPDPEPEPNPDPTPDPTPSGGRALVVYFSCTNTTKGIADRIVEVTDAATWRINPEVAYTSEDLNYNNSSSRANREQNDPSARPAIKGKCENLADYNANGRRQKRFFQCAERFTYRTIDFLKVELYDTVFHCSFQLHVCPSAF